MSGRIKILVTVGTTQFDSLIQAVDKEIYKGYVVIQSGSSRTPVNVDYFKNHDNFLSYASEFDVVVCHAGAGTVFPLLELNKKLLVVPNLERTDKHQLELANYVRSSGYCDSIEISELDDINLIHYSRKISKKTYHPYESEKFDVSLFMDIISNNFESNRNVNV